MYPPTELLFGGSYCLVFIFNNRIIPGLSQLQYFYQLAAIVGHLKKLFNLYILQIYITENNSISITIK